MYTHVQKYYEISSIIHVLASLSFFPQTLISKIVDEYAYSFAIWYHFIILINKNKKLLPNDFQNPKSWRKGDLEFHNYNSTFQSSHSSIASTIKTSGGSPPPSLNPPQDPVTNQLSNVISEISIPINIFVFSCAYTSCFYFKKI